MDLSTTYLGMKLRNPLVVGASPLTEQLDTVKELEANGAAAVVMPSLYEEHVCQTAECASVYEQEYLQTATPWSFPTGARSPMEPAQYLERLTRIKQHVRIPVMASISCTSLGSWLEYPLLIQSAGADALELNIFNVPAKPTVSSEAVEQRVLDIVANTRQRTSLPLAIKLSPFYTALPHLVEGLTRAGANGLVLFNRSYQPDVNVQKREIESHLHLSHVSDQTELRLRLRWMALLSPWTRLSLALTGGVHTGLDAIKGVMCGAHAVQIVSSLLNAGPAYMASLVEQLESQMKLAGATSINGLRGCLNAATSADPGASERAQYVTVLHSWSTRGY